MTSERRFDHDLPDLLEQLALGPTPDYRDHIVQQTARMRQRPAWMFPERWLPMSVLTTRAAAPPRVPWRIVGLVALLLVALAVGTLLIVGSQPRLPAPFGPAGNGHIAYSAHGDIFSVDPLSGVATAIVTGPETDVAPVWSRDGTRLAFERRVAGSDSLGRLYVAGADGRGLVAVTPEPRERLGDVAFSPDGRELAFTAGTESATELWIADTGGKGVRRLDVGMGVLDPEYRPPNGAEIVFVDQSPVAVGSGLYAVDVKSGIVRPILAPAPGVGREFVAVSPDGSRIAYAASAEDPNRNTYSVHVVAADGSNDVTLPMPPGATFQDAPSWSNEGTRLVVVRGYATRNQDMAIAVLPADGKGVGVETAHGLTGCCDTANEWAPDDTSILTTPFDLNGQPLPQLLLNPGTAASRPAPWAATSNPAWQRQAP